MSDKLIQIEVSLRTAFGKKNKARRRDGFTPANIVSSNKASIPIEIETAKLLKTLDQVGYTQALEVVLSDKKITVLVTDVDFSPLKDKLNHVVFFEVKKGLTVNASVPLVLIGQSEGERRGLIILKMLDEVEVSASALQIPEKLEVSIEDLKEDGDVIRLADINLPKDVEINIDLQSPIVRLEKSRSQVSQESETETETETEGDEAEVSEAETQAEDKIQDQEAKDGN